MTFSRGTVANTIIFGRSEKSNVPFKIGEHSRQEQDRWNSRVEQATN